MLFNFSMSKKKKNQTSHLTHDKPAKCRIHKQSYIIQLSLASLPLCNLTKCPTKAQHFSLPVGNNLQSMQLNLNVNFQGNMNKLVNSSSSEETFSSLPHGSTLDTSLTLSCYNKKWEQENLILMQYVSMKCVIHAFWICWQVCERLSP